MTNARIQHVLSLIESYGHLSFREGYFSGIRDNEASNRNKTSKTRMLNSIKELLSEEKE